MKIEVDIPDRYAKANLYVFAGLQPVARSRMRKGKRGPWEIKTAECSPPGARPRRTALWVGHLAAPWVRGRRESVNRILHGTVGGD
jgi:hypothetical protein